MRLRTLRCRISLICFLLCALIGQSPVLAGQSGEFLTGLRAASAEEQAWIEKNAITLSGLADQRSPLPVSVKNTEFLPPVRRQTLPNCGAFAPTYYLKTYLEARRRDLRPGDPGYNDLLTSPGIAYVWGLAFEGGASIGGTIMAMNTIGSLPLSRLPDSYDYDRSTVPPLRFFLEAMQNRGGEMIQFQLDSASGLLTEAGFLALKEWLAAGEIAVLAAPISEATFQYGPAANLPGVDNDVIYDVGGTPWVTGHAFTLIGYDDNKEYTDSEGELRRGAFLAVNSWGTEWGVVEPSVGTAGFAWFGYQYILENASGVMSMTLEDRPAPELVGVFTLQHPSAFKVLHSFRGGGENQPDSDLAWGNWHPADPGAAHNADIPLAVDVTAPSGVPSESYWWTVSDGFYQQSPERGQAEVFRIYRYEDLINNIPQALFTFVNGQYRWNLTRLEDLDSIDVDYLDGAELPAEIGSPLDPTEVYVGMMDLGQELIGSPNATGARLLFVDLNGNGLPDLISLGRSIPPWNSGGTEVYENLGGSFRKITHHGIPDLLSGDVAAADFDRDGLPDLAVAGLSSTSERVVKIFRNLGNFQFQDIGANLPGVAGASVAWGDFDNDGLEDLAIWGWDDAFVARVRVYRNLGAGVFAPIETEFPEDKGDELAWHDVNGNGWLDLTAGPFVFFNRGGNLDPTPVGDDRNVDYDSRSNSGKMAIWADFTGNGLTDLLQAERLANPLRYQLRLIHNLGDEVFQDAGISIENVAIANMDVGDYNNSGRLDLAVTHQSGFSGFIIGPQTPRATRLYRQMPDGHFRDAGFAMEGLMYGAIALADVDGDGALDVAATGEVQSVDPSQHLASARLYRSRLADAPLFAQPNTPPATPADLSSEHDPTRSLTTFSWSHGSDAQTPQAALGYNVRVGTLPGLGDVYSPASAAPVTSQVRTYRIAPDQPGMLLRGLEPGFYYWSVRTVDGGRMASEWSASELLVIEGFDPRDVNRDGVFDIADLVKFASLLDQHRDLIPLQFDFNQDGVVNQADLRTLSRLLTGSDAAFPGSYTIDNTGGTIEQDGLSLVIPAGALLSGESMRLHIERVDERGSFAGLDGADAYQIRGLPLVTHQPIEIFIEPIGQSSGAPVVFIGESVLARGATERRVRYGHVTPVQMPDGRLRIVMPVLSPDTLEPADERSGRDQESEYSLNLGVLGGYAKLSNPRFSIAFPMAYVGEDVENVMAGLEIAYQQLRDVYGFSYAARSRWPIDVLVRDLGRDEDGAMISSVWGDNYGTIEINSRILGQREKARATAAHEFFHAVQGFYDPRGRAAKAYRMSRHYWLDEAMSTWAESLVASNPIAYVPTTYEQNVTAPYLGVATGIHGSSVLEVQEYGYGMAPLIKYLVNRPGSQHVLVRIYERIAARRDPIQALTEGVAAIDPSTPFSIWYGRFFEDLLLQNIYNLGLAALGGQTPSERRLVLGPNAPSGVLHSEIETTNLSAVLHLAGFAVHEDPGSDAVFMLRFEGDPAHIVQVIKGDVASKPELVTVSFGPDPRLLMIDDARLVWSKNERLFALVSDLSQRPPYDTERQGRLTFGLANKGPFQRQPYTSTWITAGQNFPSFEVSGELATVAISDFAEYAATFYITTGSVWGDASVHIDFSYQATLAGGSQLDFIDAAGRLSVLTSTGVEKYELWVTVGDEPTDKFESATGQFAWEIDLENRNHGETATAILLVSSTLTYANEDMDTPDVIPMHYPLAVFAFKLP